MWEERLTMAKLTFESDPATEAQKKREGAREKTENAKLSTISRKDIVTIPTKHTKAVHPFEGYPVKYAMVEGRKVNLTWAIGYKKIPTQDRSGENQTISTLDAKGRPTGEEKIVTLKSPHSRVAVDYESGGRNTMAIFDNVFPLEDGDIIENIAIVPSPSARAQICFKVEPKTGQVQINDDYFLLDGGQADRLRRVFENILRPSRRAERDSRAIMGESQETLDDIPAAAAGEGG
jgi:hypothetical protein